MLPKSPIVIEFFYFQMEITFLCLNKYSCVRRYVTPHFSRLFPGKSLEKPGKAETSGGQVREKPGKKILSRWFPGKRELAKNLNFNIFFNAF